MYFHHYMTFPEASLSKCFCKPNYNLCNKKEIPTAMLIDIFPNDTDPQCMEVFHKNSHFKTSTYTNTRGN